MFPTCPLLSSSFFLSHPKAPLALTYWAELYKLKLPLCLFAAGLDLAVVQVAIRPQSSLPLHHTAPFHLRTRLHRLPHILVFSVPRCITVGGRVGRGGWFNALCICIVCLVLFLLHPEWHQNNVCKGVRNPGCSLFFDVCVSFLGRLVGGGQKTYTNSCLRTKIEKKWFSSDPVLEKIGAYLTCWSVLIKSNLRSSVSARADEDRKRFHFSLHFCLLMSSNPLCSCSR